MVINGKAAAAALVKARAAIGATVGKDAKGNFGHYATLAAVMEAIAPALAANALALVQEIEVNGSDVTASAALVHESGETIEFVPLTLPLGDRRTAQAAGSAITYARRYQLTALFGLAPDDDDGDAASKPSQTPQERTNGRTTPNHTAAPPKTQQRPSTLATATVDDAEPVDQDGPSLFSTLTPTDAELEVLGEWATAEDAYAWAVKIGGCENTFEARNSLKNLLDEQFGGKFTKANAGPVYVAYYRKQQRKAAERKQAA